MYLVKMKFRWSGMILLTFLLQLSLPPLNALGQVSRPLGQTTTATSDLKSGKIINPKISEKSFQAPSGQFVFEAAPEYSAVGYDYKTRGVSLRDEVSRQALGFSVARGFTDHLAVSVATSFGTEEYLYAVEDLPNGVRHTSRGLSDIVLSFRGFQPVSDKGRLIYGLGYSVSPQTRQFELKGLTGNRYSGGNAILTRLGFETDLMTPLTMGAVAQYQIRGEARSEVKGIDGSTLYTSQITGGHELNLEVFSEYMLSENKLGASLSYFSTDSTRTKIEGSEFSNDARAFLGLSAYARLSTGEGIEVKPELTYQNLLNREINGVSVNSFSSLGLRLMARVSL